MKDTQIEIFTREKLVKAPNIRRRIICLIYESILLFGIIFISSLIYGIVFKQNHALHQRLGLQILIFIVLGIYFIYCWCNSGQTLAMKTWNLKLENMQGQTINVKHAIYRYVLCWVIYIVPAIFISYLTNLVKYDLYFMLFNIILPYILIKITKNTQLLQDKLLNLRIIQI